MSNDTLERSKLFGSMSSAKQRDIFRAWISGRCDYYSNSGGWVRLEKPSAENASYLCACKFYRISPKEPET